MTDYENNMLGSLDNIASEISRLRYADLMRMAENIEATIGAWSADGHDASQTDVADMLNGWAAEHLTLSNTEE